MPHYEKIYETDDYLVIDKPAGLLTHGAPHLKEETLADQLLKDYPNIKKVGEDPYRPGIVHRLDKLASGLLVVAKNQTAFDHLKHQFQKRLITKIYTALIYGHLEKDEGKINFPIRRSSKGYKMAALPITTKGEPTEDGRRAITEFTIEKHYINYTLLKVKIKTGRTHQIRCHLSAYGHPIIGDDLYGTKKTREKNKKINLGRLFLVARKLSFKDLSGQTKTFKIDLPPDLKEFLKTIK